MKKYQKCNRCLKQQKTLDLENILALTQISIKAITAFGEKGGKHNYTTVGKASLHRKPSERSDTRIMQKQKNGLLQRS